MNSPLSSQTQPNLARQCAELRQEVKVQLARLRQEIEGHNATRTLLMQTQANARYWEHQAMSSQGHVQFLESRISASEARCQQLATENGRLHTVVQSLVREYLSYSISSKSD